MSSFHRYIVLYLFFAVYVHDTDIDESLRYGVSSGSYSYSRLDHCQWGAANPGFRRVITPIRNATDNPAECAADLAALTELQQLDGDRGIWHTGRGSLGVNIVALENPSTVSFTVERAIEDVNELCVKECDPDTGDGQGRCRQHDNTNGVDTCWLHNVSYVESDLGIVVDESCPPGLLNEAIGIFLCPDSSLQGSLSTAVDTTIPNVPFGDSFAAAAGECTSDGSTKDQWMRLNGELSYAPDDWETWLANSVQHEGKKCIARPEAGWSVAGMQPATLREAVAQCAANYPLNCGGVSWHHGGEDGALSELVAEYRFEDNGNLGFNSVTGGDDATMETPPSTPTPEPTVCSTRYVHVFLPKVEAENTCLSVAEIDVFEGLDGVQGPKVTIASGTSGTGASLPLTFDGDTSTWNLQWGTTDKYFDFDLGAERPVTQGFTITTTGLPGGHAPKWVYFQDAVISLWTGPAATGKRCAQWTVPTGDATLINTFVYEPSELDPPSAIPTLQPTASAQPTIATYPHYSTEAAPVVDGDPSAGSLYFDGLGGDLTIPSPFINGTGDFKVSFWFKSDDAHEGFTNGEDPWDEDGAGLVDSSIKGWTKDWGISLTKEGVAFGVGDLKYGSMAFPTNLHSHESVNAADWQIKRYPASPTTDGSWHFVEVKRVGPHLTLKLDGVLSAASDTGPEWDGEPESRVVRFGRTSADVSFFKGWIDEVKFYQLTAARDLYSTVKRNTSASTINDPFPGGDACGGDHMHRYVQVFYPHTGTIATKEIAVFDTDGTWLTAVAATIGDTDGPEANPASNAIDRNIYTLARGAADISAQPRGITAAYGAWVEIDLGSPKKISRVDVYNWGAEVANHHMVGASVGLFTETGRGGTGSCGPKSWVFGKNDNMQSFRIHDGLWSSPPAPAPTTAATPPSPPEGSNMTSGKHSFVPCLYEDLAEQTVWVGPSDIPAGGPYTDNQLDAMVHSKTVHCPYCVSCRVLMSDDQITSTHANPWFKDVGLDFSYSNRGEANAQVTVSRLAGWRYRKWYQNSFELCMFECRCCTSKRAVCELVTILINLPLSQVPLRI